MQRAGPRMSVSTANRLRAGRVILERRTVAARQRCEGYPETPADLCVEALSPNNTQRGMSAKVREYLAAGVRMGWVIDPNNRMVTMFRTPDEGRVLLEAATLDGGDVVPGFACRMAELLG